MTLAILKNNRGQGVAAEYAILFLAIVAGITVMTTYAKRALQGRIHDARNYMYRQVNATYRSEGFYPDPAHVLPSGYQPYYQHTKTDKDENTITSQSDIVQAGQGAISGSSVNSTVRSTTFSDVTSAIHAE